MTYKESIQQNLEALSNLEVKLIEYRNQLENWDGSPKSINLLNIKSSTSKFNETWGNVIDEVDYVRQGKAPLTDSFVRN